MKHFVKQALYLTAETSSAWVLWGRRKRLHCRSSSKTTGSLHSFTFSFLWICTVLCSGCSSLVCPAFSFSMVRHPSFPFSESFFVHFSALAVIYEPHKGRFFLLSNTFPKCLTAFSLQSSMLRHAFTLSGWRISMTVRISSNFRKKSFMSTVIMPPSFSS